LIADSGDVHLGQWNLNLLSNVDRVVVSPGVSHNEPIIQKAKSLGVPVVGDIQLFAEHANAPIIGVTGTNGKSTVTSLVAHLLNGAGYRALAGGNLGRAALDLLTESTPDVYVLELSSYQLEATQRLPLIAATVLNLTPDHMDRYASLDDYAAAKARIFNHAETAVLNADDSWVKSMGHADMKKIFFSELDPNREFYLTGPSEKTRLLKNGQELISENDIALKGRHNHINVLATLALVDAFNISPTLIKKALGNFKGLAHRMEVVRVVDGVTYVNDSKGTNVGATVAAIKGADAPIVLIAGGDGKGQDFSELLDVCRVVVHDAVLIGRDAKSIGAVLEKVCHVTYADNLDQAVSMAASVAKSGDWVLLSPACASLDMFENYAHRGRVFGEAVARLAT